MSHIKETTEATETTEAQGFAYIPAHDARAYICEMVEELWQMADRARLNDTANLLKVTLTAIETGAPR